MAADPFTTQIKTTLAERLSQIQPGNGYHSDVGSRVYTDRTVFYEEDTFPLLWVQIEGIVPQAKGVSLGKKPGDNYQVVLALSVNAQAPSGDGIEDYLAVDIIRAVTLLSAVAGGRGLVPGNLTITQPEQGSRFVFVKQEYSIDFNLFYGQ